MRKRYQKLVESLEVRRYAKTIGIVTDPAYTAAPNGTINTSAEAIEQWFAASGTNVITEITDVSDPLNGLAAWVGNASLPQDKVLVIPTLTNPIDASVLDSTEQAIIRTQISGTVFADDGTAGLNSSSQTNLHMGIISAGNESGASYNTDFIRFLLSGKITSTFTSNPASSNFTSFQRDQAIGTQLSSLVSPVVLGTVPSTSGYLWERGLQSNIRLFFKGPGTQNTPGVSVSVAGFRFADVMPVMYLGWDFVDGGVTGHLGSFDWKDILSASVPAVLDTNRIYDFGTTPSELKASSSAPTRVTLTWNDNSGAFGTTNESGFSVVMAQEDPLNPGHPGAFSTRLTPNAPSNQPSYVVTGLTPNTKYWFEVQAVYGGAFSDFSNIVEGDTVDGSIGAPAIPGPLDAVATSGKTVVLTWGDNSSDELGFRIQRSESPTAGFVNIGTAAADATSFTDNNGLIDGTAYYYQIQSYNSTGSSAFTTPSTPVTTLGVNPNVPASPTTLTGSNGTLTSVDLTWSDLATNETRYEVYQSLTPDDFTAGANLTPIAVLPANTTTYTVNSLTQGTTYYFAVRAFSNNYVSDFSIVLPWTVGNSTGSTTPISPTEAGITLISPTELSVFWKDNATNETGYTVERGNSATGPWFVAGTVAADVSSLYFSGLGADTTYFFRVRATNAFGDAAYSNVATARTAVLPPPIIPQSAPAADFIVETSLIGELPQAVVSGTTAKTTIGIINNGTGSAKALVTIKLVASLDTTDDSTDLTLATIVKTVKLGPGKLNKIKVKFTYPLSAPAGSYHLIADPISVEPIVGSGSSPTVSVTADASPVIAIAPPFINLSVDTLDPTREAFDAGGTGTAQLYVHNLGNVTFSGSPTIVLKATGGAVTDLVLTTVAPKLKLKSGQSKKIKIKFQVPFNFTGGIYRLNATITAPAGVNDTNAGDNSTTSLGQFGVGALNGNVTPPPVTNSYVLGTGWTQLSSTGLQYVNSDNNPHPSYLSPAQSRSDYTVAGRINFGATAPNGTILGLIVRATGTADNWNTAVNYHLVMNVGSGVAIYQSDVGSFTNLASYVGTSALAANTDYDTSLSVTGATISARVRRVSDGLYLQPDGTWGAAVVNVVSASNTAITAGGSAGVIAFATDNVARTVTNFSVT